MGNSFKSWKYNCCITQQYYWTCNQKIRNHSVKEIFTPPSFLQHYLQWSRYRLPQGGHHQMDKENVSCITTEYYLTVKKGWNQTQDKNNTKREEEKNEILCSVASVWKQKTRATVRDKYRVLSLTRESSTNTTPTQNGNQSRLGRWEEQKEIRKQVLDENGRGRMVAQHLKLLCAMLASYRRDSLCVNCPVSGPAPC